jgi:hypothetical protein
LAKQDTHRRVGHDLRHVPGGKAVDAGSLNADPAWKRQVAIGASLPRTGDDMPWGSWPFRVIVAILFFLPRIKDRHLKNNSAGHAGNGMVKCHFGPAFRIYPKPSSYSLILA